MQAHHKDMQTNPMKCQLAMHPNETKSVLKYAHPVNTCYERTHGAPYCVHGYVPLRCEGGVVTRTEITATKRLFAKRKEVLACQKEMSLHTNEIPVYQQ